MRINAYLTFDGRCEAAFRLYERVLGGKIEYLTTHAGTPAEEFVPPDWRDKVMHVRLAVGDQVLMGSDAPPDRFERPQGFSVSLTIETPEESERIFNALAEKGKVTMPMQQTFWSVRFGMLVDQFGIPWMVNCEQAP